ncbi:MAG: hypothetical protein AAGF88_03835 [Pseudomonadota bacterium]
MKVDSLDAVGDHSHAQDVARAMIAFVKPEGGYGHDVYNVAQDEAMTLGQLLEMVRDLEPGLTWEMAPAPECDIAADPRFSGGR